jgi:N-acetylmuramoyl-L-alanine amidase
LRPKISLFLPGFRRKKEFSKSEAYGVRHLGAIRHALYLPEKRHIVRNIQVSGKTSGLIAAALSLNPRSGILKVMWRPRSLVIWGLAGMAFLSLPVRSQQSERIQGKQISQLQVPSGAQPQQNTSPPTNIPQIPQSPPTEEPPMVTVVLDPAHGGADFGARGPTGLAESDVVLDFARAARIALEAQRLRVLLTREGNQDPTFDARSAMINGLTHAIFISLHVSSSGPVGTVRTYYYLFSSNVTPTANPAGGALPQIATPQTLGAQLTHTGLIQWDEAQRSSVDSSRQLAFLIQTVLVQRFKGSPDAPIAAPVRQLRTIKAPAIAIELSSIDVTDAKRLDQMAQPLAEAIGRAVAEFHPPSASTTTPSGAH